MRKAETLYHVLLECPIYEEARGILFNSRTDTPRKARLERILRADRNCDLGKLFKYFVKVSAIRELL